MRNNIFPSATSFIRYDRLQLGGHFHLLYCHFFHLFNISCLIIALIISIQVEKRVFLSGLCFQATEEQMQNKWRWRRRVTEAELRCHVEIRSPINSYFLLPPGPWTGNRTCLLVTAERHLTSNRRVGAAAVVAYWAASSSWQQKAVVALGSSDTEPWRCWGRPQAPLGK